MGSYRRWVILCAVLQAASFVPLILAAWFRWASWTVVVLAAALYWGAGLAGGPAWNTWMGRIVRRPIRASLFALRTRICQAAVLVGLVGAGLLLQNSTAANWTLTGFALIFAAAFAFRMTSAGFIARQREPTRLPSRHDESVSVKALLGRFGKTDGRLLAYMLMVQTATHLAAPYFTPFMLKQLHLPYLSYVLLLAVAFIAKIAMLPAAGRLAHRLGARRLLWIGGAGIVPLAVLWNLSTSFPYLMAVQILAGVAWGCYELATFLLLFEAIPDAERTSVLTTFNLVNAAAVACGSLLGGWLLSELGGDRSAYLVLFAVSSAARALTLPMLTRVADAPRVSEWIAFRSLAVRPSAGSIDRPILSTIPQAEPVVEAAPPTRE
jgi:MFS family permease